MAAKPNRKRPAKAGAKQRSVPDGAPLNAEAVEAGGAAHGPAGEAGETRPAPVSAAFPGLPRVVSLIVLVAVVALIGVFFFRVMSSFLVPLFLAAVLAVIFKPLHAWSLEQFEGRKEVSALATTTIISLLVVVPTALLGWMAYVETARVVRIALADDDSEEAASLGGPPLLRDLPGNAIDPPDAPPGVVAGAAGEAADDTAPVADRTDGERTPPPAEAPAADSVAESWSDAIWLRLKPLSDFYQENVNAEFDPSELARYSARYAVRIGLVGVQSLVGSVIGLAILIFALYYFFADGPVIVHTLMNLSPLDDDYERELLEQFATVSRAVVLATLLSAVVQGVLAGIGYYFVLDSWTPPAIAAHYDTPDAIPPELRFQPPIVLLTVLTMLLAIVPLVGATAVWIPVTLWVYFAQGDLWPAVGMAIYGTAVVSSIDNLIKPYVLHGQSNLHPLLALLSVLGGLQLLGPVGILVGPMLAAFMQALLGMLKKELDVLQAESLDSPGQEAPGTA
ncbi:AI-2E family transporter [Botrimarina sp.]|uniref:AI-2E family transporter n=1 Tax=Botrimarina sp. TaxID=2795802 RepID=UPI0032ED5100